VSFPPHATTRRQAAQLGEICSSIRVQGLAFSALAWLSLGVSLGSPHLGAQAQLMVLSPLILLLGVPHGALDIVFVRRLTSVRPIAGWSLFTLAYLAAAASVVVSWRIAPGCFLAGFLLISAIHFSGDPEAGTPALFRVLYGGAIIFCPLALHAGEVSQIFAALAGEPAARVIVAALRWFAWPWVSGCGLIAIVGARQSGSRSIELISLCALLVFAPPLIGFTVFFCGMHSARHVLRTRDYSGAASLVSLIRIAAWPMLATLVGIGIAWCLSDGQPLDMRVAKLLFVGLAALTVPHMMVVERIRFAGQLK
jgi:Brp/Blh family beta-carotene 15,15'-monooxygenase